MSSARVRYMDSAGMEPYPEYKDSGIEWIGKVPQHWDVTKLKYSLSDILGGGTPDTSNSNYWSDINGIPWVSISDITESKGVLKNTTKKISDEGKKSKNLPLIPKGTLLISIFASLGKTTLLDIDATVNQAILGLIPSDFLSRSFLRFFLSDAERYVGYYSSSNTQENLNLTKIKNLDHPIPLLQEQQLITTFLDRETSRIDALVEKKQQFIELLEERRSALISHAVTKGLDPDVPMKDSGIEWIGEIPQHWDTIKIKWLSPVKRGASPRPIDDPIYFDDNGDFAWVRIADVTASERYLKSTTQKLSELGSSLSVKQYPNDFFLSIAGTVGKPIITKIKCCIHDGFVWFPELKINSEYLYYIFSSGEPYKGLGKLGTQLNLNTETVGNIQIPLPSTEKEIDGIVNYLDKETSQIDTLITKTETSIEYLKEYRTALISSAVTGKIDVRGTVND